MGIEYLGLDIETTGLDYKKDAIIEIGLVPFDSDFNVLGEPFSSLIFDEKDTSMALDRMGLVPRLMHEENGLLEDLDNADISKISTNQVIESLLAWSESLDIKPGSIPMLGSSITFDRFFLEREMPVVHNIFHYRSLDATSLFTAAKSVGVDRKRLFENIEDCVESRYAKYTSEGVKHRVIYDICSSAATVVESIKTIQLSNLNFTTIS